MHWDETRFIFLDKNFSPNGGILQVSKLIDQIMPWGVAYCKLHLTPEIVNEKVKDFPVSYEFMA